MARYGKPTEGVPQSLVGYSFSDPPPLQQDKEIKLSLAGLESGSDPLLPPLMNPTMLEASDDLTNLSHLNEPAGTNPSLKMFPVSSARF